eukprot:TRINITY_DN8349_c0_g1_i4.p1 TRINITY_DN8349_c0_g1~~TRINITY_DN8349_c0_g1_i4.p1  ORF type:complete len:171 (+),score=40.27 TRINITY_DN8349_c0_g1_i4:60-515(+)
MPQKAAMMMRKSSSMKLTDGKHPGLEALFTVLGSCGSTFYFGIRLVIAEVIFGMLIGMVPWAPAKRFLALVGMALMGWSGKHSIQNFTKITGFQALFHETFRCLAEAGPYIWFSLRCLDYELGEQAKETTKDAKKQDSGKDSGKKSGKKTS